MPNAILFNLGNSDLEVTDTENKKYSRPINFREFTSALCEKITNNKPEIQKKGLFLNPPQELDFQNRDGEKKISVEKISFPIFTAFREEIKDSAEKIYIFATDQKDENQKKSDTVYIAEILKYFIKKKYKNTDVFIEKLTENPSDYNETAKFYENFFKNNEETFKNFNKIYSQISSGTPAMIFNTTQNLVNYDASLFYIPKDGKAEEINFFNQRHREQLIKNIDYCVKGLNYQNAFEIIDNSVLKNKNTAKQLILSANKLLNFDYSKVLEKLKNIEKEDDDIKKIKKNISDLTSSDQKKWRLIEEIIEIHLENENFISSLILLVGLGDNLRYTVFRKLTGAKIEKGSDNNFSDFNSYIEGNGVVKGRLEGKDLKYWNNPTKPVLSEVISSLGKENYPNFIDYDKKVEYLSEIRNKTPFAHGLEGVTNEDIEKIKCAREKLKDVLTELKVENISNILENFNKSIIKHLK